MNAGVAIKGGVPTAPGCPGAGAAESNHQVNKVRLMVCVRPPPVPVMAKVTTDELPAVSVNVVVAPDIVGVTGFGLNVAVAPSGKPLTDKVTADPNPPDATSRTWMDWVAFLRSMTQRWLVAMAKSSLVFDPDTTSLTVDVWLVALVSAPRPVMVNVYVPAGVDVLVDMERVEGVPSELGITGLAPKLPVEPVGKPLTYKVTADA
jgi:hypothetical protein